MALRIGIVVDSSYSSVGLAEAAFQTAKVRRGALTKVGITPSELFRTVEKRAEGVRKGLGMF